MGLIRNYGIAFTAVTNQKLLPKHQIPKSNYRVIAQCSEGIAGGSMDIAGSCEGTARGSEDIEGVVKVMQGVVRILQGVVKVLQGVVRIMCG